jgi:dolichyl-diphosphooligosaccharide---protein glycosyltransferase
LPHSTKKKKSKSNQSPPPRKSSARNLYIAVSIVVIIIAAAVGIFAYNDYHHSTTTASTTTSSGSGLVYAELDTSQGNFEVELFQSQVPATVNNFVTLAQSGFYNNLVWHRIQKGFVIQTGDPTSRNGQGSPCSWGSGDATTSIPFETASGLTNAAGTLGMASTGAGVGGSSQFYINLADNSGLDGSYAVFGKIISPNGLNIANAIGNLPTNPSCTGQNGGPPATPSQAMLISVTILPNATATTT